MKAVWIALFSGVMVCGSLQSTWAADAVTYREAVLHSFGGGTDGQSPQAGLIDVNGTLYGTTGNGGSPGCNGHGCGTVFSVDANSGAEKILYSFCAKPNCVDGAYPETSLVDVNGTLYGTTEGGGAYGYGTVFALDANSGAETVLYSFCMELQDYDCLDGADPESSLISERGTLYGTTEGGGTSDAGTVFALDPRTGKESVLYSFCSQDNCADGAYPVAGMIQVKGTLYGTTGEGGSTGCNGFGCGTVFSIRPQTGAETVIYSFAGGTDGQEPFAGVIDVKGLLYGTTLGGGRTGCLGDGCGTVFSVDPGTGAEKVLYAFCQEQDCPDGALPRAGLIEANGRLYGTTAYGGHSGCPQTGDCGTGFSIDPDTGAETVLYTFCNRKKCTDGWAPSAGLDAVKGTFYGTTTNGGSYGYGTVFALNRNR